ncbi:hypothetical protein Tco_0349554 [Tanacetum coccineum]
MGDENPIRTLGDYSKPSYEGYMNTIELPVGNNMVPLRSDTICGPHNTQYCMEDPEQAFVEYASSRTDEAGEGLVSKFMASQDARLSKFEADFKRQQGEMTNKIDTVLKAITDQIAGTLPSDTIQTTRISDTGKAVELLVWVNTEALGTESKEHDTSSNRERCTSDDVPNGKNIHIPARTKGYSEPTNGSNDDITNQYECKQTLDVSAGHSLLHDKMTSDHNSLELGIHDHNNELSRSKLVPKVVPPADKTYTSRQELELLFHPHITLLRSWFYWCREKQEEVKDGRARRRHDCQEGFGMA